MRMMTALLFGGLVLVSAGGAEAKIPKNPDAEIARITAGRIAGAPADCIYQRDIRSSQIVGGTAIVYRMNNGTIYVNRPKSGKTFLRRDQVMVTDTHSPRLCSIDTVRLLDSGSHMSSGSVGLGKFVPYTRPRGTSG